MTTPIPELVAHTFNLPTLLNQGLSHFESRQTFKILFPSIRSQRKLRLLKWAASDERYPTIEQFGERLLVACCAAVNSLWLLTIGAFSHLALSKGWKVITQSDNDRQLTVTFLAESKVPGSK